MCACTLCLWSLSLLSIFLKYLQNARLSFVENKINPETLTRFRCWMCLHVTIALADAIVSMTNVTVMKLYKENSMRWNKNIYIYISLEHIFLRICDKIFPTYLMKANIKITLNPNAHPARLNTTGKVRAPVPTMRLKMYVNPTYSIREFLQMLLFTDLGYDSCHQYSNDSNSDVSLPTLYIDRWHSARTFRVESALNSKTRRGYI